MRTSRRIFAGLVCVMMMLSLGISSAETITAGNYENRITFSATSINLPENVSFMDDDVYRAFDKKFNFAYDLINITWETWDERDRLWITSGDMPDMLFWNFYPKDYKNYSEQGLVKALPDDLETKYPNLAAAMKKTGISDYLKAKDPENKLYMIPNVIYLNPPTKTTDLVLDPKVVYYRKDWATKVGITVGDTMTVQQLAELAQAFIEKDPGGNGAGATIGLSAVPSAIDAIFVQTYNAFFNQFHKDESGKYVWGGFEDATLAGVKNLKKYYDMGIIDHDYYAFKGKEHYEKFDSGIAGMFMDGASAANVNERFNAFGRANPGIDPASAIGLATVISDDGVYRGEQNVINYWAGLLFNPDIEDEKLDRILSILDYTATEEGQRLIHCGIEGRDFTIDGDILAITRAKDENGNFVNIADLYPSYNFFFTKAVLPDDWSARDLSLPAVVREMAVNMYLVKEQKAQLVEPDYDIVLFNGEKKLKFALRIDDLITEMILSGEDIDAKWQTFIADNSANVQGVLDEVNASLVK
ncbi:MAG: hypothetical protein RR301_07850 [Clostridia bacterium]